MGLRKVSLKYLSTSQGYQKYKSKDFFYKRLIIRFKKITSQEINNSIQKDNFIRDSKMKKITNLKELEIFLGCDKIEENLMVEELNIVLFKETISQKMVQKFSSLHISSPIITELRIKIEKTYLDNLFLHSLQSTLENLSSLKIINLNILNGTFSMKRIKQFAQYIHSKYFPQETIQYKSEEQQILLRIGECKLGFKHREDSSLLIKNPQIKVLEVFISKRQINFLNIIESEIQRESDNYQVLLYHQQSLVVSCSNCSPTYSLKLKVIFEETSDLFQYTIDDHTLVEINITTEKQRAIFSKSEMNHQIKVRHSCGFLNKKDLVFYSFKNSTFSQKQQKFIEQTMIKYQINFQSQVILNNQFKICFFKLFLLPIMTQNSKNTPFEIEFLLRQLSGEVETVLRIKNRTKRYEERLRLKVEFNLHTEMLDMIKHYFNWCSEDEGDIMKLMIYNENTFSHSLSYPFFMDQLSKIDTKNYIHKFSIKFDRYSKSISYPIIPNLKYLKILSLSTDIEFDFIAFLRLNANNLNMCKTETKISLVIAPKYTNSWSLIIDNNSDYLKRKICSFDRITDIQIYTFKENANILREILFKFKRLTKLTLISKSKRDHQSTQELFYSVKQILREGIDKYGKLYFAYQFVDIHDDSICSWINYQQCKCNNDQIQILMKKSIEYFVEIKFQDYKDKIHAL